MITYKLTCPQCSTNLKTSKDPSNQQIRCPFCSNIFIAESSLIQEIQPSVSADLDEKLTSSEGIQEEKLDKFSFDGANLSKRGLPSILISTDVNLLLSGGAGLLLTALFYIILIFLFPNNKISQLFADRGVVPYGIAFLTMWSFTILLAKFVILKQQRKIMHADLLPLTISKEISTKNAHLFIKHLLGIVKNPRKNIVINRIFRSLENFQARGNAHEVSEQLRTQAYIDANAVEASFTMLKVFIWAIPILGFIGTVSGISEAVSEFSQAVGGAAELDVIKNSLGSVTSGLGIAFDTTLLALLMSLLVMFPTSVVQKSEEGLLDTVEIFCNENLLHRFELEKAPNRGTATMGSEIIRQTIAEEMAKHHSQLQLWTKRLETSGDVITKQVLHGWDRINKQLSETQEKHLQRMANFEANQQKNAVARVSKFHEDTIIELNASLTALIKESNSVQQNTVIHIKEQSAQLRELIDTLVKLQQEVGLAQQSNTKAAADVVNQLNDTFAHVQQQSSLVAENLLKIGETVFLPWKDELQKLKEMHKEVVGESRESLTPGSVMNIEPAEAAFSTKNDKSGPRYKFLKFFGRG